MATGGALPGLGGHAEASHRHRAVTGKTQTLHFPHGSSGFIICFFVPGPPGRDWRRSRQFQLGVGFLTFSECLQQSARRRRYCFRRLLRTEQRKYPCERTTPCTRPAHRLHRQPLSLGRLVGLVGSNEGGRQRPAEILPAPTHYLVRFATFQPHRSRQGCRHVLPLEGYPTARQLALSRAISGQKAPSRTPRQRCCFLAWRRMMLSSW
jgi:hypothetical protein